jgi:hypothetical protein
MEFPWSWKHPFLTFIHTSLAAATIFFDVSIPAADNFLFLE